MVNVDLLRKVIKDSGMTMVGISRRAGIVRETLYNRLDGKGEFTASEITGLTDALHLTKAQRDRIFFDQ